MSQHHLDIRSKLVIMGAVMASLFLVALDQTIVATALSKIVEDLNAYSSLSWIVTAYLLTTTVTVPIAGKLSDLFGRRIMLLIGVALFGVSSLFSGLSSDITSLILWRAVQGIGGGIITANAFTIIGDLFAARERGRWQGLLGAVFGIASVIGPLLGGWLTDKNTIFGIETTWHWIFWINVPIALVAFGLIMMFCPSLRHAKKARIDYLGAGLLTALLATIVLAVDNTEKIFAEVLESTGWSLTGLRVGMAGLAAVLLILFVSRQRRAKEPIMPLAFFRNRNFSLIMGIAMLFGAGFLASILYLTQFNQQVFDASPTESGLMLIPMVAGIMVASIGSGQLIVRTGKYKRFMQVGMVIVVTMIGALTTLNPESSYLYEAVLMTILGLGMGLVMPIMNLTVQNEFEQKDLGVATSAIQLFRGLGSTVGVAILGGLLTSGLNSNLADIQNDKYLTMVKQNSSAVKQIGDPNSTDTQLILNMPDVRSQVRDKFDESLNASSAPQSIKQAQKDKFISAQNEYHDKIVTAFSDSLRNIFMVAAIIMAPALILVFRLKERELKQANSKMTPGEI